MGQQWKFSKNDNYLDFLQIGKKTDKTLYVFLRKCNYLDELQDVFDFLICIIGNKHWIANGFAISVGAWRSIGNFYCISSSASPKNDGQNAWLW